MTSLTAIPPCAQIAPDPVQIGLIRLNSSLANESLGIMQEQTDLFAVFHTTTFSKTDED